MGFSFVNQQSNLGIMVEEAPNYNSDELDDSIDSSSEVSSHQVVSSDPSDLEEEEEEVTSSISGQLGSGPLLDMSSLLQQLPIKRGLSKHFQGKSQSFTSLSNVRCLEDLAKPENPYNKKLKSCKSYGLLLNQSHRSLQPSRRLISKRASKGSCSSLGVKKNTSSCLLVNKLKPPINHRSASTRGFCNQTRPFVCS